MALQHGKFLGLALEDRVILAAEVSISGQGATVTHAAEFSIPQDASIEQPEALGCALGEFLREKEFSAKVAVAGVPARWLLSTERIFPATQADALASMVRLDTERRFATEMAHLALDYSEGLSTGQGVRLLVTAVAREKIEHLQTIAHAAGLKLKSIVPTALAFASATQAKEPSRLTLLLRSNHVEAVTEYQGRFTGIKHLPVSDLAAGEEQALSDALLRVPALMPDSEAEASPSQVQVWNGAGLREDALEKLGEPFGRSAEVITDLKGLGLAETKSSEEEGSTTFCGAAAVALAGARTEAPALDFLHSRLAPLRKARNGRKLRWAVSIAAIVLIAVLAYALAWRRDANALRDLQGQLQEMGPAVESAERLVGRATLLRGWTDRRPRFLEPARELAALFTPETKVWLTSLAMREDMRVVITGKSSGEESVLELLDRIRRSAAFDNVDFDYVRQAGSGSRDVSFSMAFDFADTE